MSKDFKIGIYILYISLFFTINPWFIYFTFIFIIIGIIRIMRSSETFKKKITWIIFPFLIWLPLTMLFFELFMKDKIK
jgi:hypothetical protein